MAADCLGRNTLLDRYGGFASPLRAIPYVRDDALVGSQDVCRLVQSLEATFSGKLFRLLFVTHQAVARVRFDQSLDRRVITAEMQPDPPGVSWEGTNQFWGGLFQDSGVRIESGGAIRSSTGRSRDQSGALGPASRWRRAHPDVRYSPRLKSCCNWRM